MWVEFLEKTTLSSNAAPARLKPKKSQIEQQQNTPASSWVSKDDADAQS